MLTETKHQKRTLTGEDRDYFMNTTPDSIDLNFLHNTFTDKYDVKTKKIIPSRFNVYDEIKLKKNEYLNCEEAITTCGLIVFNKTVIEPTFGLRLGYINFTLSKKGYGKLQNMIANIIIADPNEEEICKTFFDYMDRITWLSFTFHSEICSSMNLKISKPLKSVESRKKQLIKENKESFEGEVNLTKVVEIQNELVDLAKKEMENDSSYELYASGARGAFDNAYRQAQIMKGPVYNPITGEWEVVQKSLYEGYDKKDLAVLATSVVDSCYAKAISTGECGYLTKKIAAGFQSNVIDDPGTDCKTPMVSDVIITDDNFGLYEFHYIKEGSKYIRLDSTTKAKYLNKRVKMRLPGNCCSKKLCSVCAGERYYLLNIRKIGITNNRVSNSLLRARMKQAHDATVRLWHISLDEAFQ